FVLERKRLELGGFNEPAFLRGHHHRAAGFTFEQLVQLMRRQARLNVLSDCGVLGVALYDVLRLPLLWAWARLGGSVVDAGLTWSCGVQRIAPPAYSAHATARSAGGRRH